MTVLLELDGVRAAYGPVQALFSIDLALAEGEVLALLGRNGMGKTTTVRTIMRMLPLAGGRVSFAGQDISRLPSHRAAQLGLGLVPEGRRCFAPLTVSENLSVAARPGEWTLPRVLELFPRLGERMGQPARTLSGGEQQMLAIARALLTNPRALILDEATEGLAPVVRAEIWAAIRALKGKGISILVIDKSLKDLRTVADRAAIVERGRTVWHGAMADMGEDAVARHLGV
ncbi:High-affinity branched-chain amino acid transport ATP-binding protein LivF [Defluviimonas aquaemixtae]|uniref:High-affinity branched-chain amino acid transport ATP-binding protein LivF n=1 Tax=Albidovulum aquaemixtae TaxID=1542388 RepID=A0A2R8B6X3_9RHOB|nr:ABC transporter ATP-binding protein [Defluviimonas aquaemixtae]SPH18395.1 High-affinity branched-chain amino acid transport ATP-binding protein LivF [Defluviimonas aquaemixtae]